MNPEWFHEEPMFTTTGLQLPKSVGLLTISGNYRLAIPRLALVAMTKPVIIGAILTLPLRVGMD